MIETKKPIDKQYSPGTVFFEEGREYEIILILNQNNKGDKAMYANYSLNQWSYSVLRVREGEVGFFDHWYIFKTSSIIFDPDEP